MYGDRDQVGRHPVRVGLASSGLVSVVRVLAGRCCLLSAALAYVRGWLGVAVLFCWRCAYGGRVRSSALGGGGAIVIRCAGSGLLLLWVSSGGLRCSDFAFGSVGRMGWLEGLVEMWVKLVDKMLMTCQLILDRWSGAQRVACARRIRPLDGAFAEDCWR